MKLMDPRLSFLMVILSAVLLSITAVFAAAVSDPFVGEFIGYADDDRYYLSIIKTPDGHYKGRINVEGEMILLSAKKHGDKIVGEINEDGDTYEFTATVRKDGSLNFTDEAVNRLSFSLATLPNQPAKLKRNRSLQRKLNQLGAARVKARFISIGSDWILIN